MAGQVFDKKIQIALDSVKGDLDKYQAGLTRSKIGFDFAYDSVEMPSPSDPNIKRLAEERKQKTKPFEEEQKKIFTAVEAKVGDALKKNGITDPLQVKMIKAATVAQVDALAEEQAGKMEVGQRLAESAANKERDKLGDLSVLFVEKGVTGHGLSEAAKSGAAVGAKPAR